MPILDSTFDGAKPISCAEGRHGEIIVCQEGHAPVRWGGTGAASAAGLVAPTSAPAVTPSESVAYYVARTDVTKPGAVYSRPPEVSYEFACAPAGASFRAARARAYLENSSLSEISVESGGKYYPCEPTVALSASHGTGAVLTAALDSPETYITDPNNSPDTGLTGFAIVSDGPPWGDEQALPDNANPTEYAIWEYVDVPISGNGIQRISGPRRWFSTTNCNGGTSSYFVQYSTDVEVVGYTAGVGARVRVFAAGHQYLGAECSCPTPSSSFCYFSIQPATGYGGAAAYKMGKDYDKDAEVAIIIPAVSVFNPDTNQTVLYDFDAGSNTKTVNALHWQKAMVIRLYSGEDPRNPGGGLGYPVKSIDIVSGGTGYLVAPQLKIVSGSGFGAYATCTVSNGAITSVTLENGGGGYKSRPEVRVLSGGAEAFAISRPHLRGIYQCYYRYTDSTAEDFGGPIPSCLSPVAELDTGEGAAGVTWSVEAPDNPRATHIELWRSTSGQALTLYRVARIPVDEVPVGGFYDDLTDEEVRDPDRAGYEAMPILLPNGELNAMRFVPPPVDKAVVVRFQDRMWYGVGGASPNAIYYSEVDEPESVPQENELIVQQNARDYDKLTAMIPMGSTLFLAQGRHLFSLTFSQIPALDGQLAPAAYRGCLSQRCWCLHDGHAYIADRYGLYRLTPSGQTEDLTSAVRDQFDGKVDIARSAWSFVTVDPATRTARYFLVHTDDGPSDRPTRALCCDIDTGALWWEKYPQAVTAAALCQLDDASEAMVYACQSGAAVLDKGHTDLALGSIVVAVIEDRGSGYKVPPKVFAQGGHGAVLQASLNADGEVSAVWILDPGFGYQSGPLVFRQDDNAPPPGPGFRPAAGSFEATSLLEAARIWPTFHFKTGCVEYPSDADTRNGGAEERRDLRVFYKPTQTSNELSVRMYYNNADNPRINVAERDRGTGFVDSTVDPASRMDLGYLSTTYGEDSGAARVVRTGKTLEDIRSGDRDVSVEICGPSRAADPVTFYGVDIFGGAS